MPKSIDLFGFFALGLMTTICYGLEDCPIDWKMYESVSKEKALIKCLLDRYKNYSTVGRPVTNTSDMISVEFGLSLIQIMDVDEKNQVLETNVWYTYKWTDALLQWDPEKFDGLQKIMVPPESVWIPDIVLYNFADSRLKEQRTALVNVFSDGEILWMPQAILRSTCAFNSTWFPFDEAVCYLKFGSWTHDGTKMDINFFDGKEHFMVMDFVKGNEWDMIGNYGNKTVKIYECCKDVPYLDLKFYVRLKRKTAFYRFILLLPCALLSCLTLTIFWVPPESPAKLQLGKYIALDILVSFVCLSYQFCYVLIVWGSVMFIRVQDYVLRQLKRRKKKENRHGFEKQAAGYKKDARLKEQRPALVNIEYTGDIIWMPQAILRSSCGFEIKFFPFDTQRCYLQFGSWTHDGNYLDLQFFNNITRFMVDDYIKSNEWDMLENRGERNVKVYECCKDVPYLDLRFHVTLRRKVAFYTFILIMPCALLTCLTLVIFCVPPEAPAKLSLGMNIFVAFFVLLLLLSESTPKAAESIPLIGAYFCLSMVMITMSTVLSTVIANMFFRGVRINRAPRWLRFLMIDIIASVLCLKKDLVEPETRTENQNNYSYKTGNQCSDEMRYAKLRLLDNGRESKNHTVGFGVSASDSEQNNVHCGTSHEMSLSQSLSDDIHTIRLILEQINEKRAKAEMREKCLREWKVICCVTDRLFFISYLCINIIGIVVIFFGQNN